MTATLSPRPSSTPATATATLLQISLYSMSDLLEVAIRDARTLDPRIYHPNSVTWHVADEQEQCQVCLAGSVIAGTLAATPDQTLSPDCFPSDTPGKLEALNFMRKGHWVFAFYEFYRHWPRTSIEDRLRKLPKPINADFTGWHAFRAHLDSLESILPELREIELIKHWF